MLHQGLWDIVTLDQLREADVYDNNRINPEQFHTWIFSAKKAWGLKDRFALVILSDNWEMWERAKSRFIKILQKFLLDRAINRDHHDLKDFDKKEKLRRSHA